MILIKNPILEHLYQERKEDLAQDLTWTGGILGSLSEERALGASKSSILNKDYKLYKSLHKKYSFPLLRNAPKGVHKKIIIFSDVEKHLSEISSSYPRLSGLNPMIVGMKIFEGKNGSKKVRDFLIWFTKSFQDEHWYWKWLILEKFAKKLNNQRNNGKIWIDIQQIIEYSGNPIILNEFLNIRYPDKVSIEKMFTRGEYLASKLKLSLVPSPNHIAVKQRQKGYDDKGSLGDNQAPRGSYGFYLNTSYEKYLKKRGELIMEKDTKHDDLIFERMIAATEQYLAWLRSKKVSEVGNKSDTTFTSDLNREESRSGNKN